MNFLRQLTTKPWLPESEDIPGIDYGGASATLPARVGLKMFLIVVSVLFFMLTVAYVGRLAFEEWRPVPQPWLMWQNTIILILASAAMQLAQSAAQRGHWSSAKLAMLAGGVCSFAFLIGQTWAWQQLVSQENIEFTNPAVALFILITGLHGLHLLGGLAVWTRTIGTLWWSDDFHEVKTRQTIELCTLYWHFLLVVWLVLFTLLFSGNDFLGFVLSITGAGH